MRRRIIWFGAYILIAFSDALFLVLLNLRNSIIIESKTLQKMMLRVVYAIPLGVHRHIVYMYTLWDLYT
ncbi:MAG: hypothetical protein IKP73_01810 [Bacteroidales bacterium]|nr:hypothetical protein [Bacteroidales bacterium]